ncbi:MAG TPA: SDR family oxidoreductase, partial [Burkholderiales bacterium]|nr:SDR family oxidoreductase [Burkholderiales bacterium]
AAGGQGLVIGCDVANAPEVEAAAERAERELGPIEVWVNNAMATVFCDALSVSDEDFRRATDVTYFGAVWGTRAALRRMKPRNRGAVVQVGSALAYRSIPLQAPYCAAKSALRGFTDSLRSELIHDKSRVHLTMVHLAAFNTPQFDWGRTCIPRRPRPVGKIFQPEIAAEAIYWASRRRRRELWVGWPAVQAILGQRFVAPYLDRRLAHEAWDGQLSDEPLPPGRRDNLWEPVPGDAGAHGRFDSEAIGVSVQHWLNTHRGLVAAALLGAGWLVTRATRYRRS